jgi:hypothetical protein
MSRREGAIDLAIAFTPEEYELLAREAADRGITVAAYVRRNVTAWARFLREDPEAATALLAIVHAQGAGRQ